ncbi:MAG TPA: hypothetical protein VIG73_02210 [Cerasibacillus sp.]|uniref:hypothetical protein n=1 Tax=Cerasibacillus sp. TaxID=2498711 RepID=UPI002F42BA57
MAKKYELDLIRCPICQSFFKQRDIVAIDILNTMSHAKCLYENPVQIKLDIKEVGKYQEIVNKYGMN